MFMIERNIDVTRFSLRLSPINSDFDPFNVEIPVMDTPSDVSKFKEEVDRVIASSCGSLLCKGRSDIVTSEKRPPIGLISVDIARLICRSVECPLAEPPDIGDREPLPQPPTPPTLHAQAPIPVSITS